MGNVCPRRVSDTVRQEQINSRDAVCTVSPRNRQHVWDVPGVNIHCPLCDDVLFSTPLDLAAGLLDFLLDHRCEGHHSYTIAARIHSAVCLSAALGRATDLPELVYQKITKLLGQSGKTNALEILQEATLLHSKFLLELCFGCNAAPMPSRLALRLFSAMQVADDLKIWNIVEELRALMKRNWPQHRTPEGHRLQVACVVLQIYGLTSVLAGSSRILDTLEKSVASALDDITTAAQAMTMTESHQVSSFGVVDLEDKNTEVSWLVSWVACQAAAVLFAKPCNAGQMQITAWSIKHTRELATGQPASSLAVSLRAVSLLVSWRQKLESTDEETLVEVVKALSAASHYSTSQGTTYCQLTMSLIEMPSLILQLARTRCILHEGQQASLLSVPGMSGEHDKLSEVMKSGDGLSPEQLPLEFLKWPEEWPEDEAISLMIRDRLRPEAIFTVHPEVVLEGEDILMQTMSLPAAKVRCTSLPNCIGFYSDDWPSDLRNEVDVHFKTTWKPKPVASRSSSSAVAYQKERASPLFTRREGYGLDGAELFVAEMTIEAAKRCCSDLENCMGFTLKSHLSSSCSCSLIQFKSGTKLLLDSTSCCYVLETESRSLHLPADGNAFFQLMDEGNEGIGAESP